MLIFFLRLSIIKNRLADQGINDKGIISNDKTCAVSGCEEDRWCDITLVCKLMDDL